MFRGYCEGATGIDVHAANLSELIEGRLSSSAGRSELLKLAARLIIEKAPEEESQDALGRHHCERGGDLDGG